MDAIFCFIEENELLRRITVRQYCRDEELKEIAVAIAVTMGEIIEYMEGLKLYRGQYVENREISSCFSHMPIEVSFSVLYNTEEAKEKFKKLLENYN